MASVFRKQFTQAIPKTAELFVDKDGIEYAKLKPSKTGKGKKSRIVRVIVGQDGTKRLSVMSGKFIPKFRDHKGVLREVTTGQSDESAAIAKLNELVREQELLSRGVITIQEVEIGNNQSIATADHLASYLQSMRSAGRSDIHVADTKQKIESLVADCSFFKLSAIRREPMEKWLVARVKEKMAPRTRNGYLQAIRGFLNWCIENGRLTSNPLVRVVKADEKLDRRKLRRAMTETELSKLLHVALWRPLAEYGREVITKGESQKTRANWTYAPLTIDTLKVCCERARNRITGKTLATLERKGRERMLVYKTLLLTGLRCNELRSIRLDQVILDGRMPCIELLAADEKNRNGSVIPLRGDLAQELREWIEDSATTDNLITGASSRPLFDVPTGLIKVLDRDLVTAGIPKTDNRGRSLDVHALRTSFGTMLSKAGVFPRTAQAAMRHSRIDLTMNVYTDPAALDIAQAVESLPTLTAVVTPKHQLLKSTQTTGSEILLAPFLAPTVAKSCQDMSISGKFGGVGDSLSSTDKNEKTLEFIEKTRVFVSEVDGGRTRNLRIDSPVL